MTSQDNSSTKSTKLATKHPNLATALAAFQANLPSVGKSGVNSHFRSKYADLADVSKVVLPALAAEGLAFTASPTVTGNGFVLAYSLLHESGEKLAGEYPLNGSGTEQQKGSALTYSRRYVLGAVTGVVADDDDDGNAASQMGAATPAKPSFALPTGWRASIEEATSVDVLNEIYARAAAQGWVNGEVLQVLKLRKEKLLPGGVDGAQNPG